MSLMATTAVVISGISVLASIVVTGVRMRLDYLEHKRMGLKWRLF